MSQTESNTANMIDAFYLELNLTSGVALVCVDEYLCHVSDCAPDLPQEPYRTIPLSSYSQSRLFGF